MLAPMTNTNTGVLVHQVKFLSGAKKFIPKKPAKKEMGMNRVVMMVRVFMIPFIRLFIVERKISSVLLVRS